VLKSKTGASWGFSDTMSGMGITRGPTCMARAIPQDLLVHAQDPTGSCDIALGPDQHPLLMLSGQVRSAPHQVAGIDASWTWIHWAVGGGWSAQLCRLRLSLCLEPRTRTVTARLGWTLSPNVAVDVRPAPGDGPLLCCGVIPAVPGGDRHE
jgi:hypothetical protein